MGFTTDACWFLLIKTLLIKNNKKREAALNNEAGGDEKQVIFFTWPYGNDLCISFRCLIRLLSISSHWDN